MQRAIESLKKNKILLEDPTMEKSNIVNQGTNLTRISLGVLELSQFVATIHGVDFGFELLQHL